MQVLSPSVSLSYYLPAEWGQQSGVMLTWPHQDTIWAETLADIDKVFAEVAHQISLREKVLITCHDKLHVQHIMELLEAKGSILNNIYTYIADSDDIWVRDHGPITVLNHGQLAMHDFTFNGWGNKYPASNDNLITHKLVAQGAFRVKTHKQHDMVLEGGGIETDGMGTLLTTTSCLLSKERNPGLTKEAASEKLKELFGVSRVVWLNHGKLAGDDTDGHIDTLARFTDPQTICYVQCNDETDDHYLELKAMEKELQTLRDIDGDAYNLVPLPWPQAKYADYDGRRLPVTYANFLIINNAVLVPTYDDPADNEAIMTISECFPDRDIIGIDCCALVQWYGSLHCMTMQLPSGAM